MTEAEDKCESPEIEGADEGAREPATSRPAAGSPPDVESPM
jgi:hypothetical protein